MRRTFLCRRFPGRTVPVALTTAFFLVLRSFVLGAPRCSGFTIPLDLPSLRALAPAFLFSPFAFWPRPLSLFYDLYPAKSFGWSSFFGFLAHHHFIAHCSLFAPRTTAGAFLPNIGAALFLAIALRVLVSFGQLTPRHLLLLFPLFSHRWQALPFAVTPLEDDFSLYPHACSLAP
jgi:hypothetical protein